MHLGMTIEEEKELKKKEKERILNKIHNIIVVGSGPAALTAAIYSYKVEPIIFEGSFIGSIGPGGQLTTTTTVDNYPGYPNGVQGPILIENMYKQVHDLGIEIISQTIQKITKVGDLFYCETKKEVYKSKSVIVATGASAKKLNVDGSERLWQKGISACAVCDGLAFMEQKVAVIGGGDTAMEEVMHLSKIASKVLLIHRRIDFRARKDNLNKVKGLENVEILTPYRLFSANGNNELQSITLENTETYEKIEIKTEGLFYGIGHDPNTWFLDKNVKLYNKYIIADKKMKTNVEGLFACGDVQDYKYRQAITAVGSGCIAAKTALKYLNSIQL